MSKQYITEEGARELEKQEKILKNAIQANAVVIASKENRLIIDEEHIKKAAALVKNSQSGHIKWFVIVSTGLLFSFATLQVGTLSTIPLGNTLALWILPTVVFVWILILSYVFKDFLI